MPKISFLPKAHSTADATSATFELVWDPDLRRGFQPLGRPAIGSEEGCHLASDETASVAGAASLPRDLGAMRTMMAADRTLMAWIRTAISLFGFSFAIYKILQELQDGGKILPHENTPRNVGIFLATMGTAGMVMGTIEYWFTLQELRNFQQFRLCRPPFIMAILMSMTGILLCIGIVTRLF